MSSWRIENAVDGETSSNKTSCLSLTSCLGNPCVPPFTISKCEWALKSLSPSWNRLVSYVLLTSLQRETDGSDVTIVALKLAMSLHFPLPKFALGDEFTLSLAKNLHFSFLPSHFPSHPSYIVTIVVLNITIMNEFWLSIAKSFALFVPTSQVARLFFPSKKWIKLIPKTIGNRKRDCAWGGSGW